MDRFQSKEALIERSTEAVYERISRLDALTPMVGDKVEKWQADADSCSFVVMGFPVKLRVSQRQQGRTVRVEPEGESPMRFDFAIDLQQKAPDQTAMQITMNIDLNPMMRMMLSGKLREGVDKIASAAADYLNRS